MSGAACSHFNWRSHLDFDHPPTDPFLVFKDWFDHAVSTSPLPNPNAMTVATADETGRPSARIVLLKAFDDRGFVFFTNRQSRKGLDLAVNQHGAIVFHWDEADRQVRIEGRFEEVEDAESDEYFASRPRESRLNAWASEQSRPIESRSELESRRRAIDERFPEGIDPPRPAHWGGYRLVPTRIEFWQGHPYRLHDRVLYRRVDEAWRTERLMP
ncbi:MAG: pyridoxamine 5'-phosphate oxidase [Phycisphaera sp.]|nr:pyridoxamine 5'-phosphate oxidase [Phycisphaera sp.]